MSYLVNLLRGTCISEKKVSMPYEHLIQILCKKHKHSQHMTGYEMDLQLQLLQTLACKFFTIKAGKTLKIAKIDLKADFNQVHTEISSHLLSC